MLASCLSLPGVLAFRLDDTIFPFPLSHVIGIVTPTYRHDDDDDDEQERTKADERNGGTERMYVRTNDASTRGDNVLRVFIACVRMCSVYRRDTFTQHTISPHVISLRVHVYAPIIIPSEHHKPQSRTDAMSSGLVMRLRCFRRARHNTHTRDRTVHTQRTPSRSG